MKQKMKSSCKITRRKVVQCFFYKRRKKNFSERHKECFYETANGKQCLRQVSLKNIVKQIICIKAAATSNS